MSVYLAMKSQVRLGPYEARNVEPQTTIRHMNPPTQTPTENDTFTDTPSETQNHIFPSQSAGYQGQVIIYRHRPNALYL